MPLRPISASQSAREPARTSGPTSAARTLLAAVALLGGLFAAETTAFGQEVATTPVGAVTLTIQAAPSLSTPRYTYVNFPLLNEATATGTVTAATTNTLTVGVNINTTINASNPHYVKFNSGPASGSYFQITSNSGSTLTISNSGIPINSLVSEFGETGNSVSIIPADTLDSLFGNLTQGGPTAASADQVWIWQQATGQYARYYYNTTNTRWQDTTFNSASNNVAVKPDSGVVFLRRATSNLELTIPGVVPVGNSRPIIRESGFSLISGGYPIGTTLLSAGIHLNSGWVAATSASAADQIWIWQPSTGQYSRYYFHSGNNRWQDTVFNSAANSVALNSGVAVFVKRLATTGTANSLFEFESPYTL